MNREFLESKGLEKDIIDSIMAEYGKSIGRHKQELEAKGKEIEELSNQLTERDTQLEELKESTVDNKELQAKLEEIQKSNETLKNEYQGKLEDEKINNAIKLSLAGKVHDVEVASQLINRDDLFISEDGEVVGVDVELNKLQESKGYLFKQEETKESGFDSIGYDHQGKQGTEVDKQIADVFGNNNGE